MRRQRSLAKPFSVVEKQLGHRVTSGMDEGGVIYWPLGLKKTLGL